MYRTETVNRWVVEQHEELNDRRKAEYRINGIDPDNYWTLKCSYKTEREATFQRDRCREIHATICEQFNSEKTQTYRVRDIGAEMTFEIQGGLF